MNSSYESPQSSMSQEKRKSVSQIGNSGTTTTPLIPNSNENRYAILHVDVNLGPNQMDRIIVYEGDTPDSLTEQFAIEHSIFNI